MIAAYNEDKGIGPKIEESLKLDYPKDKLEIAVVSDGSTDRTDEIVKSYASQGVRLIRVEGRVGKTEARNVALKEIESEIVLFSVHRGHSRKMFRELLENVRTGNFLDRRGRSPAP